MTRSTDRERLADAIFEPTGDLAGAISAVLAVPSVPDAWLLAHAVAEVKTQIFELLDTAARCDASAGEAERDTHEVLFLCGQVMAYCNAADHIAEVLVEVFDLWPQYDTRELPGKDVHDRAAGRFRQIMGKRRLR